MITHIVSDMGGVLIEIQWQSRVEKLLNFFDDGTRNVEVARELGMQAFQVTSPDQLLAVVEGFGAELAV